MLPIWNANITEMYASAKAILLHMTSLPSAALLPSMPV